MRVFDQVDASSLDRREWHLWMLAVTVILILAVGVALLMFPPVYSEPISLNDLSSHAIFLGFCGLATLTVSYLVIRQAVVSRLRKDTEAEQRMMAQYRQEASRDLLETLPGLGQFRDRLAIEYAHAYNSEQPLSIIGVELRPSHHVVEEGKFEAAFGDAAKALMSKLRVADGIFLFAPGTFGVVLPAVSARGAYAMRDRVMDGLHDAAGASDRFTFTVHVVNFPEHATTARDLEKTLRSLLTYNVARGSSLDSASTSMGIQ